MLQCECFHFLPCPTYFTPLRQNSLDFLDFSLLSLLSLSLSRHSLHLSQIPCVLSTGSCVPLNLVSQFSNKILPFFSKKKKKKIELLSKPHIHTGDSLTRQGRRWPNCRVEDLFLAVAATLWLITQTGLVMSSTESPKNVRIFLSFLLRKRTWGLCNSCRLIS